MGINHVKALISSKNTIKLVKTFILMVAGLGVIDGTAAGHLLHICCTFAAHLLNILFKVFFVKLNFLFLVV